MMPEARPTIIRLRSAQMALTGSGEGPGGGFQLSRPSCTGRRLSLLLFYLGAGVKSCGNQRGSQPPTQPGARSIVAHALKGHCSTFNGPGRPCSTRQQPAHASDIKPVVHDGVQYALTVPPQAGKVFRASLARQAHVGDTLVNVEDGFSRAFLLTWVYLVSAG